jgi:heptosyltransferase-2
MLPSIKLCVIRFSSMGDVVLQTSLLAALKSKYQHNIHITFVTSKEFTCLVDKSPVVDEVVSFDRKNESYKKFLSKLKSKHVFDFILDLHGNLRSRLFRWKFFSTPSIVVDKRTIERDLFCHFKTKLFEGLNDVQLKRLLMDFYQILELDGSFTIVNKVLSSSSYKAQEQGDYICIIPTASFYYKRWPIENFINLSRKLLVTHSDIKIKVLAGPSDDFCKPFDELESQFKGRIENLQGKTTLDESCELVSNAKMVIGNDTGLVHVAESAGVNCIDIFGPTHPFFGFGPHLEKSKMLHSGVSCSPCSSKGDKDCKLDQHECMLRITVDHVYGSAMEVLGENAHV